MLYGNMNLPDAEFYIEDSALFQGISSSNVSQFSVTTDITRNVVPALWEVTARRNQIAA